MAKRNVINDKYEKVSELPANALTVAQYAAQRDCTTNYIYNMVRENKNRDFKIVVFNSFNFVVPITLAH